MSNSDKYNRSQNEKPWMHGMAGVLGGAIAMSIFYPLDFLRTRMHTLHQGSRALPLRSAKEIIELQGLRSMYRGICVSVISHSMGWGLYLLTFREARKRMQVLLNNSRNNNNNSDNTNTTFNKTHSYSILQPSRAATTTVCQYYAFSQQFTQPIAAVSPISSSSTSSASLLLPSTSSTSAVLLNKEQQHDSWDVLLSSSIKDFLSACIAALVTGTIITPLHVIKTRRQLYDAAIDRRHLFVHQAKGLHGVRQIIRHEGWLAMFRGWGPQIILTGSTTLQVTIYECFRRYCFTDYNNPSLWQVAFASAFSKVISTTVFNPLEVVRTRLQDRQNAGSHQYRSMWSGVQTIWRTEGMLGLYRGLPVNILRVIPSTMMSFVLYEKCLCGIRSVYSQITSHAKQTLQQYQQQ